MAQTLLRKTLKVFGLSGPTSSFGQFGSKAASVPQTSKDPTIIQQLTAWIDGWQNAVVTGDKVAYIEDMNGWCYVHSYELGYVFQMGIPEWDSATTYCIGSVVQGGYGTGNAGQWFVSLQDANLNNTPPTSASNAFWRWTNAPVPTIPTVGNSLKAGLVLAPNNGAPQTKVNINASLLSVQGVCLSNVALIADITVSGANGLDTGSPTNNRWYAVYVISNSSGSISASLLSASGTSPTLPVGYTLFRRVGWARRNGSSAFIQFKTVGDWVYYTDSSVLSPTLSDGTVNFGTLISPTSAILSASVVCVGSPTLVTWKPTGENTTPYIIAEGQNSAGIGSKSASVQQLTTNSSQQASMAGTSNLTSFTVLGYYDPV